MALCCHSRARILCLNSVGSVKTTIGQQNKSGSSGRTRRQRAPSASSSRTVALAAADTQPLPPAEASPSAEFTLRCQTTKGERILQHVESGDLLRDAMLAADPPVDVYTAWGKVTNCNGGGAPQQPLPLWPAKRRLRLERSTTSFAYCANGSINAVAPRCPTGDNANGSARVALAAPHPDA